MVEHSHDEGAALARQGRRSVKRSLALAERPVRLDTVPAPEVTEDEDVILKITGTTICVRPRRARRLLRSAGIGPAPLPVGDRRPAEGRHPRPRGPSSLICALTPQFMGIIDAVGPGVRNRKVGDRVVVSFQIACASASRKTRSLAQAASASTARRSSRACVLESPERAHTAQFCDRTNDSSLMQKLYGQRDAGFFGCASRSFAGADRQTRTSPAATRAARPSSSASRTATSTRCRSRRSSATRMCCSCRTSCPPRTTAVRRPRGRGLTDAVVDTGVENGDVVAVWGLGPIGLCALKWAKLKGPSDLWPVSLISQAPSASSASTACRRASRRPATSAAPRPSTLTRSRASTPSRCLLTTQRHPQEAARDDQWPRR